MTGASLARLALALGILMVAGVLPAGCRKADEPEEVLETEAYLLPEAHADDAHPLKERFFQEPFQDLGGESVRLEDFRGAPLVVAMFPSFLTEDGRRSLLALEALVAQASPPTVRAIVVPFETADLIEESIVGEHEGMSFVFQADNGGNLLLLDRYAELFWDEGIIAVDFPLDLSEKHHTVPFYWVVDEEGTIREKLIDYSDDMGIEIADLATVLDALTTQASPRAENEEGPR